MAITKSMKNLVPLKVKIGLRSNGHADHPDWMQLPLAATEKPADHIIISWKYDKTSGHQEETLDSPFGMQWGMILVTEQFATEAVATFPELVTVLTEVEATSFWEEKAHAHMPENRIDTDYLQGLKAEKDLRTGAGLSVVDVDNAILKALDPDNEELGVRKNKMKYWDDAKIALGVTIAVSQLES
jgi:hypothetical protein